MEEMDLVRHVTDKPRHMVGTKSGAIGARIIRRLEPTKLSETPFLLGIQYVP